MRLKNVFRFTGSLAGLTVLMTALAGCEPESVEESQAQRMNDLSGQSYTKEQLQQHPAEPGEPMVVPDNSRNGTGGDAHGTPVAPGDEPQALPMDR